ncbi:MAG: CAP domain-containing protein [Huintestinicola sp.]|uniref:CAP domain-containing protein n=1 Tax=Huintestinicola sp. TaxID=2981661 RepID=UPI003F028788
MKITAEKSLAVFLSALILMLGMVSWCAMPVSAAQTVGLNRTSVTLEVGQSASLKLNGTSGGKITWSMSNKKVAKYSKGKVTGVSEGTAYIYAKYNGKKYKCKVTVVPASEDNVVNVKKGGSVGVYVYTDINEVMIECSDSGICSVSGSALSSGEGYYLKIKGRKNGTASFKIYDAHDSSVSLEFDIKVGSSSDGKVTFKLGGKNSSQGPSDIWGDNEASSGESSSVDAADYIDEVIRLINEERAAAGKPALKRNDELCKNAQVRAEEIGTYFSHTRPNGTDCFTAITVPYGYAGENIAMGQRTPQEVMDCWMGSSGHKKNILSSNYTSVGVGYDPSTNCWVQLFISE